jgi:hypothetical protein
MSDALWLPEGVPYRVHLRSRAAALLPTASVLALNSAALLALGHWLLALVDLAAMATALAVYLLLRLAARTQELPPPGAAG